MKYLKFKEPDIDKDLMKKDIKSGIDLSGLAHLERTQSVRVRWCYERLNSYRQESPQWTSRDKRLWLKADLLGLFHYQPRSLETVILQSDVEFQVL